MLKYDFFTFFFHFGHFSKKKSLQCLVSNKFFKIEFWQNLLTFLFFKEVKNLFEVFWKIQGIIDTLLFRYWWVVPFRVWRLEEFDLLALRCSTSPLCRHMLATVPKGSTIIFLFPWFFSSTFLFWGNSLLNAWFGINSVEICILWAELLKKYMKFYKVGKMYLKFPF